MRKKKKHQYVPNAFEKFKGRRRKTWSRGGGIERLLCIKNNGLLVKKEGAKKFHVEFKRTWAKVVAGREECVSLLYAVCELDTALCSCFSSRLILTY